MLHEFSIQKIIYKKSFGRVMGGRCQVREKLRARIGSILATSFTLFWYPVTFAMSVSFLLNLCIFPVSGFSLE